MAFWINRPQRVFSLAMKTALIWAFNGFFIFSGDPSLFAQSAVLPFGDFGDAPTVGMFVGYNHVDPFTLSDFPTGGGEQGDPFIVHRLPGENGFLGKGVTAENAPLLIDQDLDDGWTPRSLATCKLVQLSVRFTVPDEATVAPLYLNVLFDWNHDGAWRGAVQCPQQTEGPGLVEEWPIQNLALDQEPFRLGPGFEGEVMLPVILTGPQPGELWARFTLATEPLDVDVFVPAALGGQGWDGQGDFIHGETEDYFLCLLAEGDDFLNCPLKLESAAPDPSTSKTATFQNRP